MKPQTQPNRHRRLKAIGVAVGALALGIGLLILSRVVMASGEKAAAAAAASQAAASSAPATAPATAPAPAAEPGEPPDPRQPGEPTGRLPRPDPKYVAAQRMSNLLTLFGLMGVGLAVILTGWVVYDVRQDRPAWKKQSKHPQHSPRRSGR